MKKTSIRLALVACMLLAVVVAVYTVGCNKNKECKAIVTALNASGSPLPGAEIRLKPGTGNIADMVETSDASGKASFTTDLPKIMDIYLNGNNTGKVVRFEEGKTDEVTVP